MISEHLEIDRLYAELRSELEDMSQYLDSDALRRQGETMVRLTVVATVGLIGVGTTGVLGMNLFALAEEPPMLRVLYFLMVLLPIFFVTLYTVLKSRRLADFLEALAEEHRSPREKLAAMLAMWRIKHGRHPDRAQNSRI
jgi:hypothetical protein